MVPDLARIERLRDLFLAGDRGGGTLGDYWRDRRDLVAYDAVLGARIGWKWDAALAECLARGFGRADDAVVLDFGCGAGVAARRFVARFGAREVLCHDRSRLAMAFAVERLRADAGAVAARPLATIPDELEPDVLLVSHVLGELDAAGESHLHDLIRRARRTVIVEPGNRAVARRLSRLRDALLPQLRVLAPCPHRAACPALARDDDWCHFFATPPPEVFTTGAWVRSARALGIDLRSLPYSFLALTRTPAAGDVPPANRVLGRAHVRPHDVRLQLCTEAGLADVVWQKRTDKALWRALKKAPERVRHWPPGDWPSGDGPPGDGPPAGP